MNIRGRLERLQRGSLQHQQTRQAGEQMSAELARRMARVDAQRRQEALDAGKLAEYEQARAREEAFRDRVNRHPDVVAAFRSGDIVAMLRVPRYVAQALERDEATV